GFEMGSQYAYGEGAPQNGGQMNYYAAPRGFNTVAEHIQAGQAVEHIPHRLFVGGFGAAVNEAHLREHFERFFTIRDVKVIRSPEGLSKGYGFLTFDTEEEAKAVQAMDKENLKLNGKTLNLGPALRKMVHSRYNNSDYAMATPNGAYSVTSPTMQYSYTYPAMGQTPYMPNYAPQGMVPLVPQSLSGDETTQSHSISNETNGEELQQMQQLQQPVMPMQPQLTIPTGMQGSPYAAPYYVPPPTPMTPTFRMLPFAPLYYPPQTPQMTVDGSALYPPQAVSTPLMYHPQFFPPTPSMDGSFNASMQYPPPTAAPAASPPAAAAAAPLPSPIPPLIPSLMQQSLPALAPMPPFSPQHYPPIASNGGGGLSTDEEEEQAEVIEGSIEKQPIETGRVSYASIVAKVASGDAKEVEQAAADMESMKINVAGGDYGGKNNGSRH
ncbi:hypothetical protein PFISCL1PPCAC_10067, partial [Pristionchus fissidentatus]